MAAMGPPGGGRTHISERLLSRFNVINLTFPSESQITRIYGTLLSQHVAQFDEDIQNLGNFFCVIICRYNIFRDSALFFESKLNHRICCHNLATSEISTLNLLPINFKGAMGAISVFWSKITFSF